jgi:protein-disulfide isomerase
MAPLATWAVVAVASLAATIVLERLGARSRAEAVAEAEAAVAAAIGGSGGRASNAPGDDASRRLQGRHAIGPADAPIEIVVFSDYQCPDCRRIDGEIEAALDRGDVRFTPKHMPLASDCNPLVERSLHPDACRRAALAEAAGRLGGAEAFHAAHRALFKVAESDGDPLDAVLEATGLSRDALGAAMSSPEVAAAIRSDVEDAVALGVTFTPMVFVNGVEWKWYAGGSRQRSTLGDVLVRAVGSQRATPPSAVEKLVDDWARVPALPNLARRLPGDLPRRPQDGAESSSPIESPGGRPFVVAYLDYAVEGSRILDAALMRLAEEGVDFTWIVRPFPASSACNEMAGLPSAASTPCDLARIVAAADAVGGGDAARRAHEVLLRDAAVDADGIVAVESEVAAQLEEASRASSTPSRRTEAVARFREALVVPSTLARIRAQAASLHRSTTVRSVPTLVVDGRVVPRWEHPGATPDAVLRAILTRAARDLRASRDR